jgi:hypothetical protein
MMVALCQVDQWLSCAAETAVDQFLYHQTFIPLIIIKTGAFPMESSRRMMSFRLSTSRTLQNVDLFA